MNSAVGPSGATESEDGVPTTANVLLVENDRVTRRFVELALDGLQVAAVGSAAAVIEHLAASPIDLILCGSRLSDTDGIGLCRQLRRDPRFKVIPFLILSSDQRAAVKTAALDAGVSDYIPKPCDPAELAARVRAHIDRARVASAAPQRSWALAGNLDTLTLPDLLSTLEYGRHTGLVAIATPNATGQVFLEQGRVTHAVYRNITGAPAFQHLMAESTGGQFEFCPTVSEPDQRTLDSSVSALVLEAARVSDEGKTNRGDSRPNITRVGQSSGKHPLPQLVRSADAVRSLLHGVLDGWHPGELALMPQTRLRTWTRGGNAHRFHIHLISSISLGVSALVSLGEPLGEDILSSALGDEPCALTLTLRLRNDHVIDVLLLDLRNLERWARPLMRSPSLTIIAPPGGDTLSFGAQVPVALNRLLERLPPAVITVVGRPGLQRFVRELDAVRTLATPVHETPGVLGEHDLSLRKILDLGLRAWGEL